MEHPVKRNLHWIYLKLQINIQEQEHKSVSMCRWQLATARAEFHNPSMAIQLFCQVEDAHVAMSLYQLHKQSWEATIIIWPQKKAVEGYKQEEQTSEKTWSSIPSANLSMPCCTVIDDFRVHWLLNVLILWKLWFRCTCMLVLVYHNINLSAACFYKIHWFLGISITFMLASSVY